MSEAFSVELAFPDVMIPPFLRELRITDCHSRNCSLSSDVRNASPAQPSSWQPVTLPRSLADH